jgi:hypothetical protein
MVAVDVVVRRRHVEPDGVAGFDSQAHRLEIEFWKPGVVPGLDDHLDCVIRFDRRVLIARSDVSEPLIN